MFGFLFCFRSYHHLYFDDWDCYVELSVSPSACDANMVVISYWQYVLSFFFFLLLLTHLICFVCCSLWQTYCATKRKFQWWIFISFCYWKCWASVVYNIYSSVYISISVYLCYLLSLDKNMNVNFCFFQVSGFFRFRFNFRLCLPMLFAFFFVFWFPMYLNGGVKNTLSNLRWFECVVFDIIIF